MRKIGIITQARLSSTRLPGKILLTAKKKTLFELHIERLQQSKLPVYVATTTNPNDVNIEVFCEAKRIPFYKGSETNVLERYYETAKAFNLQDIVRVTSDCPLIDGELIAKAVQQYQYWDNPLMYMSNSMVRTYPRGFDFEIFSFELLEEAYKYAKLDFEKEHVTPFIKTNKRGNVQVRHFMRNSDKSHYRITLDEQDDYSLLLMLIEQHHCDGLDAEAIIEVLDANPKLATINQFVQQKS